MQLTAGERNLLVEPLTLAYDPLGRLWQLTSGSATTQFVDDGGVILDELTTSGTYIRRFAYGAGSDEPVGWYEGVNAARPAHHAMPRYASNRATGSTIKHGTKNGQTAPPNPAPGCRLSQ